MSHQAFAESILATLDKLARERGLLDDDDPGGAQTIPPVPTTPPAEDRRLPREREPGEDD